MNIFHLSPNTVKERLEDIQSVPEFRIHLSNPKILQLIIHHNRAKSRLNFLHQVKLKCASLYLLSKYFLVFFFLICSLLLKFTMPFAFNNFILYPKILWVFVIIESRFIRTKHSF